MTTTVPPPAAPARPVQPPDVAGAQAAAVLAQGARVLWDTRRNAPHTPAIVADAMRQIEEWARRQLDGTADEPTVLGRAADRLELRGAMLRNLASRRVPGQP